MNRIITTLLSLLCFVWASAAVSLSKPVDVEITLTPDDATTAIVSWTETGEATNWQIELNDNQTVNADVNPYRLENLSYATIYTVKVRAMKGEDVSQWSAPATFNTQLSDDMCQITLVLTDSDNDTWTGNAIKIVDKLSGIEIGTYSNIEVYDPEQDAWIESKTQTYTVSVPNDREIEFSWIIGNYPEDCSYVVYDVNEEIIFQGSGVLSNPFTYHVDCAISPWQQPTNVSATNIGINSAVLSWTENGGATSWIVAYKGSADTDFTEVQAGSNPFTLTGLTPDAEYTVKVRPNTTEKIKWSEEITFTTAEQFEKPVDVAVSNVTFTSATVSWTGQADSYDLRYKKTGIATIILEVDDVWGDGTGYQMLLDANAKACGRLVPNDEWQLSDELYNAFEYKIPEDADGDVNTTHMLLNANATIKIPAGVYDWFIVNLDPEGGIYIADSEGNTDGRYDDFSFEAGKVYTFHVYSKNYNEYVDLEETNGTSTTPDVEWTTIENISGNSKELTGLEDDNGYQVEMRSNYGTDNHSNWTDAVGFVTLSDDEAPYNLATTNVTNESATLTWTGHHDSYNLQWRIAEHSEVLFEEGFENGLGAWTSDQLEEESGITASDNMGGANSFLFYIDNNEQTLITPLLADITDNAQLSFYYMSGSVANTEEFQVGYSTTTNSLEAFTWSEEISINDDSKQLYSMQLPTGVKYVAIKVDVWGDALYIDDFVITSAPNAAGMWMTANNVTTPYDITGLTAGETYEWQVQGVSTITQGHVSEWSELASFVTPETYPLPTDLAVSQVMNSSAVLSWTAGSEDQTSWDIGYKTGDETDYTVVTVTENPYTLTNLLPETDYVVKVRGYHGSKVTKWTRAVALTTLSDCSAPFDLTAVDITAESATLNWSGVHDSYNLRYRTAGVEGSELSRENFSNGIGDWTTENLLQGGGVDIDYYNYYFCFNTEETATQYIISPLLTNIPAGAVLTFRYANYYEDTNTFCVGYSTKTKDVADFTWSAETTTPESEAWFTYEGMALPEGVKYIAIKCTSPAERGNELWIDDVVIAIPEVPAGDWNVVSDVTAPYEVSGLASGTSYEWQVQGVSASCGGTTEWSEINNFATLTVVTLADDGTDNSSIIASNEGKQCIVTLQGRKLYKDDCWNTLTLPFFVDIENSVLEGATAKTLTEASIEGNTVKLTFGEAVPVLQPGVPYIIKWPKETGANTVLTNPIFTDVYMENVTAEVRTISKDEGNVMFTGYYDAFDINATDHADLYYLTPDNTLRHTGINRTLNGFRAYFQFHGLNANSRFVLNFGDGEESTGVIAVADEVDTHATQGWYTLDGMQLDNRPTRKGVYLYNGRKVVVK